MEITKELIYRLEVILKNKKDREFLVKDFVTIVLNIQVNENLKADMNKMINLATDLDYYEPREENRKESNMFFGDDELEEKIRDAISNLSRL